MVILLLILLKGFVMARLEGMVEKGWGHELIFATNDKYCGKLLNFNKGAKFSMHFHDTKALALSNIYASLEEGISKFEVNGELEKIIEIKVDIAKLNQLNISIEEINQILTMQNIEIPSGAIKNGEKKINVQKNNNHSVFFSVWTFFKLFICTAEI